MKQICLLVCTVVCMQFISYSQVENKFLTQNFNFSSSVDDTWVVDEKVSITIPESGNYMVIVEAQPNVPTAAANGCLNTYWNDGYGFLINKRTNVVLGSPGVGSYRWYMTHSANGCQGGFVIPQNYTKTYIVSLVKGDVLGMKFHAKKVGTLALGAYNFFGKIMAVRLN